MRILVLMRTVLLIGLLLVIQITARAQKTYGSVKGTIVDTTGKQDLSEATVSVTPISDSSDIQYATTDKNGSFRIKNLTPGNYSLLISFEGYQHIRKSFVINSSIAGTLTWVFYICSTSPISCRRLSYRCLPYSSERYRGI
jgi:hypothetical protein